MERVNYLLDTNVLLKFGLMDFIETKTNAGIIIPMVVIQELDRQKYLDGVLGYQARKAIREIADVKKYGDIKEWVSLQNNISVHVEKDFDKSNDNIDDVAWYWINSGDKRLSGEWDSGKIKANNGRTRPVGSKTPNELGIYDMSGNVWEWMFTAAGPLLVLRGGSWSFLADICEVSDRNYYYPDDRGCNLGIRVLRTY